MLFDFPIAIAPNFYKLDLGDLPCLIGAFSLGPVPALLIQVVKIIIKLLLKPTSTAFIGELAAFLFSSVYCIFAAYIYSLHKNKKQAVKALIIASIIMVLTATAANYLFIIPFYVRFYGIPLDVIIGMGKAIFPAITNKFMFVLLCVLPFNAVKAVVVGILTMLLYKRISPLLK